MPVAVVIALTLSVSCRSASDRQAADAADNTSQVAASTRQQQLWQEAAEQGNAPGLERVPIVQDPISQRNRAQAPDSQSKPSQSVTIPQGVRNQIRILVFPDDPFTSYTGPAKVMQIDPNDPVRVTLDLGGRTLTVLVRVNGDPLPLMMGEMVTVAYQTGRDPRVPNDIIAIRKDNAGAGIAHVVRGGNQPLQGVDVPLFNMTVRQSDMPGLAAPPVTFSGPSLKGEMGLNMGQTESVGSNVSLRVVGSTGLSQGVDRGLIEGVAFTVNVLVWRVP